LYALEKLAALTCKQDQSVGTGMFRQATSRMGSIAPDAFYDEKLPRLPVASFTRLWQMMIADAKLCDPALPAVLDTNAFKRRRAEERQQANSSVIARAMDRYEEDPDRAAQLMDFLLEAGDPTAIDFGGIENFLAKLRERAPELGDDVFRHAAETIANAPAPGMADLNVLGKYLFVDGRDWKRPDQLNLFQSYAVGSASVFDFGLVRVSANEDLVGAYIDALQQMVEQALKPQTDNPIANSRYDATVAYSLVRQMVGHARQLEFDSADKLTELLPKVNTGNAAQVAALPQTTPDSSDALAERRRRIRAVITAIRRKKFADARREMNSVGDELTTRQIVPLIEFAEAAAALSAGDLNSASSLTNQLRPGGVKRGLLYAGIVSRMPGPQHEGYVSLVSRDAQSTPPEFRAAIFSALAVALLEQNNPERAYTMLKEVVDAWNEARVNPRQGRFDPRRLRGTKNESSQGAGSTTDVPTIPLGINRFYMVIDTGENRINYELAVPGVAIFTLQGALKKAQALDLRRLESLIESLRDDTKQAEAYLAIAELRFKPVATQ
jgi:hypothetical protein